MINEDKILEIFYKKSKVMSIKQLISLFPNQEEEVYKFIRILTQKGSLFINRDMDLELT